MRGRVGEGEECAAVLQPGESKKRRGVSANDGGQSGHALAASPLFCANDFEGVRDLRRFWQAVLQSIQQYGVICADKEMPDVPETKLDGEEGVKVEVAGWIGGCMRLIRLEMVCL